MLITVPMPHEPGSPYPPALPPPLLPKPAKDNLRLQKLLRKAAKKKAGLTSLQSSPFRASLSPVSEASHDQDVGPQPRSEPPRAAAQSAPPAAPTPPKPWAPPTPLAPPSPLALPDPPRILVPAPRSPYKPVIQHVASPLQKKSFTFNLTEQRSLAEHFRMTTPQLGGPGPDAPHPPGCFAPVAAPREKTHVSRVHIHVGPARSPCSPAPAPNLSTGSWGKGEQDGAEPEAGEEPGAHEQVADPPEPSPTPQKPMAPIQPLIPNAQPASPRPEPPPTTRLSPGVEAAAPRQLITKIVVPIVPTYGSPGPSQHSPLPRTPLAKAEPPPVPPKPNTLSPKLVATSDPRQPPDPPRDPLLSSVPSPAPGGEGPKAAPTPIPRTRFSGWTRLKKELIVAPEVPPFPEPKGPEAAGQGLPKAAGQGPPEPTVSFPRPLVSRATKMWDAILYRMSVAKSGSQPEGTQGARAGEGGLGRGSFLPLLYRPHFDARKLRELAAQPPAKVSHVLGVSLRPSLAPKNFNRTAACWQLN
ncbi:proline-rich protein 33 [Sarcophilus harrisii]